MLDSIVREHRPWVVVVGDIFIDKLDIVARDLTHVTRMKTDGGATRVADVGERLGGRFGVSLPKELHLATEMNDESRISVKCRTYWDTFLHRGDYRTGTEPAEIVSSVDGDKHIDDLEKMSDTVNCVVIADYGKAPTVDHYVRIIDWCNRHDVPVVVDTKRARDGLAAIEWAKGVQALKISQEDACKTDDCSAFVNAGTHVFLTGGHRGVVLMTGDEVFYVPGYHFNEKDPVGAGDCFTAAVAMAYGNINVLRRQGHKARIDDVTTLLWANLAAGFYVEDFNGSSFNGYTHETSESIDLEPDREITLRLLRALRQRLDVFGRRLVLANGCFDVFHAGHANLLEFAAAQEDGHGGIIVTVDVDTDVARLKGDGRPVFPWRERARILGGLRHVRFVVPTDSTGVTAPTLDEVCQILEPGVLVKGAEYEGQILVGQEHCDRVAFAPMVGNLHSTAIVEATRGLGGAARG